MEESMDLESHPSELSLIESHLVPWTVASSSGDKAAASFIHEADPYTAGPADLPSRFPAAVARDGQRACYFLTRLRPKSDRGGRRVDRTVAAAGGGGWHGEGQQKAVFVVHGREGRRQVGWRQSFSFKDREGARTGWIMWELRLYYPDRRHGGVGEPGDPVLCKVYRSPRKPLDTAAPAPPPQGQSATGEMSAGAHGETNGDALRCNADGELSAAAESVRTKDSYTVLAPQNQTDAGAATGEMSGTAAPHGFNPQTNDGELSAAAESGRTEETAEPSDTREPTPPPVLAPESRTDTGAATGGEMSGAHGSNGETNGHALHCNMDGDLLESGRTEETAEPGESGEPTVLAQSDAEAAGDSSSLMMANSAETWAVASGPTEGDTADISAKRKAAAEDTSAAANKRSFVAPATGLEWDDLVFRPPPLKFDLLKKFDPWPEFIPDPVASTTFDLNGLPEPQYKINFDDWLMSNNLFRKDEEEDEDEDEDEDGDEGFFTSLTMDRQTPDSIKERMLELEEETLKLRRREGFVKKVELQYRIDLMNMKTLDDAEERKWMQLKSMEERTVKVQEDLLRVRKDEVLMKKAQLESMFMFMDMSMLDEEQRAYVEAKRAQILASNAGQKVGGGGNGSV